MALEPTQENQLDPPNESGQSEAEINDKKEADDLVLEAEQMIKYLKVNKGFYPKPSSGEIKQINDIKEFEALLIKGEIARDKVYEYWDNLPD
jgi:hypothetical protein